MNLDKVHSVYFAGIGGIGMSALARYFASLGKVVGGYDRVRSAICKILEAEGMEISYEDGPEYLPKWLLEATLESCLVVYTPALPASHMALSYLRSNGYAVLKRAEVLGLITKGKYCIAVAGTHGKTSTSALITHLLNAGGIGCNAFLGGIANNLNSNVSIAPESNIVVVEADEYDRSFLKLSPNVAVVTSVEADHLDIYGSGDHLQEAFQDFVNLLPTDGKLFCRKGLPLHSNTEVHTYGIDPTAQISATGIAAQEGYFTFTVEAHGAQLGEMKLAFPGRHNVENALAAIGVALHMGLDAQQVSIALASFTGVKRRFETHVRQADCVYIDDYAHHPTELKACIGAARELYPERRITGVFQPHLYSRTRDFGDEFARSLEALNDLLMLEIYPAREEPIPGIDSTWLLNKIQLVNKKLCTKEKLLDEVLSLAPEVLLTMGAGDIDAFVEPLTRALNRGQDE